MKDDLDRAVAWMRAQDPNATIWLHVEEAKRRIEALEDALRKARNTLAGCGMAKIAADICDAALSTREATGGEA